MCNDSDLMLKIVLSALELSDDLTRLGKYQIAKGFEECINTEEGEMNEKEVFKYYTGVEDIRLKHFVWDIICYFQ